MASIHQVNHPGRELQISYNERKKHIDDYYFLQNSCKQGVRLWNRSKINEKNNSHKRKFFEHKGKYISDLNNLQEQESLLRFWGEYEGYSEFELLNNTSNNAQYWDKPCAVHKPFFNNNSNTQNTDPYIFGDEFYYAVCKKDKLKNLQSGDIVLFGSEFGKRDSAKFYLDTVFVIKDEIKTDFSLFDNIYIESTLKKLETQGSCPKVKSVHRGIKFEDKNKSNNSIFSFVPCKVSNKNNTSFGRPIIDTTKYGDYLKKPGAYTGSKSKSVEENKLIENLWKDITKEVLSQGFYLGTKFDQITTFNTLPI